MQNFLNKLFKLEENKTTIKTEIIGGFLKEECSSLVSNYFKQKRK